MLVTESIMPWGSEDQWLGPDSNANELQIVKCMGAEHRN